MAQFTTITFRLEADLASRLRDLAHLQRRSLSAMLAEMAAKEVNIHDAEINLFRNVVPDNKAGDTNENT